MRIAQIEHFLAAVRSGSLRSASRTLGISQPAITKSIRQLEDELHVQLLRRNARGAALTPAGKAFLARASVVESELRKVQDDLQAFRGGTEGRVAMGLAPQACMLIVPEAMTQFRRRFATARVRIVEGVATALLSQVMDGTLDFAVSMRIAGELPPSIGFRPLFKLPLVVAARAGHPLRAAGSLRELSGAQWLMFYPVGSGAMLERAFGLVGADMPKAIVQCESYAMALALLAKTDTLGLVFPQMLADGFGNRHLQQIRIAETIPAPLIGVYTRSDAPLTSAASAMVQAVVAAGRRVARGNATPKA